MSMDEATLAVSYQGEELELPVKMYPYGYTFRIEVIIGECVVIFEPDEEGSYRALVSQEQFEKNKMLSRGLLQSVAERLEHLA